MFFLVLLHLLFVGLPIFAGIMRVQREHGADAEDIIEGATGFSVVGLVLIAVGEGLVAIALALANYTATDQTGRQPHPDDLKALFLAVFLAYPILLLGLALAWRGWAAAFALAVRRWERLGITLHGIVILPLVVLFAYADYIQTVFGLVVPFGDIAETIRSASPGAVPTTYVSLDGWVLAVLGLLTPLAVTGYGWVRLRRMDAAVRMVQGAL